MELVKSLLDFIYPMTCIVSDERLDEENSNVYISDFKLEELYKISISDRDDLKKKLNSEYSFSNFAFYENDDFSKIIYQLKYGGMKRLGIFLGELLGKEIKKFIEEKNIVEFDFIIPVPLFKTKLRERGYNQSDFICKGISNVIKKECRNDFIKRTRHTKSQTKLNKNERMENVKDAFIFNDKFKNVIFGKRVMLIDDVITTGATLNEVTKVLRDNMCGEILVATLAMARD